MHWDRSFPGKSYRLANTYLNFCTIHLSFSFAYLRDVGREQRLAMTGITDGGDVNVETGAANENFFFDE